MTTSTSPDSDTSVVIRSSGERTEALCSELVVAQGIRNDEITVIRQAPFARALRSSYETGIASGRKWTLCLDADVLLLPGSIERMVSIARRQDPSVFEIQGKILDKFVGGPRDGGIHLYRTALLGRALECIPPEDNTLRPELQTLEAMTNRGFHWRRINYLTGIHGFEQYCRDIFRTCFVHARKHQEYAELFVTYWGEQRATDSDFQVALEGYAQGLRHEGDLSIDSRENLYQQAFDRLQIAEKPDLKPGALSPADIGNLVDGWIVPAVSRRYFRDDMLFQGPASSRVRRMKAKLGTKTRTLGIAKLMLYVLGRALEEAGTWMRSLADPYVHNQMGNE